MTKNLPLKDIFVTPDRLFEVVIQCRVKVGIAGIIQVMQSLVKRVMYRYQSKRSMHRQPDQVAAAKGSSQMTSLF